MHDIWRSGAGLVETMCRSEPGSQIDAILRDGTEEHAGLCMLLAGRPCTHKRLSDQVSDNRLGQRWTPADTHGRSVAGQGCYGAGSPHLYLASGRRGHTAESGYRCLSRRQRTARPLPVVHAPGCGLAGRLGAARRATQTWRTKACMARRPGRSVVSWRVSAAGSRRWWRLPGRAGGTPSRSGRGRRRRLRP